MNPHHKQILRDAQLFLENCSKVLESEQAWIGGAIKRTRDETEQDLTYDLQQGRCSDDEAAERRSLDKLEVPRRRTDLTLQNLAKAADLSRSFAELLHQVEVGGK